MRITIVEGVFSKKQQRQAGDCQEEAKIYPSKRTLAPRSRNHAVLINQAWHRAAARRLHERALFPRSNID